MPPIIIKWGREVFNYFSHPGIYSYQYIINFFLLLQNETGSGQVMFPKKFEDEGGTAIYPA